MPIRVDGQIVEDTSSNSWRWCAFNTIFGRASQLGGEQRRQHLAQWVIPEYHTVDILPRGGVWKSGVSYTLEIHHQGGKFSTCKSTYLRAFSNLLYRFLFGVSLFAPLNPLLLIVLLPPPTSHLTFRYVCAVRTAGVVRAGWAPEIHLRRA